MKISKFFAALFAVAGLLLAVGTVRLSFASLDAKPVMLRRSDGVAECAAGMLDAACRGDFAAAGAYMYGSPTISSGADVESETGKMIWEAFVDSLSYELLGECYASDTGIALDVRIRSLEFSSVTAKLRDRSQALLEQRVQSAEDVSEIYDGDNNYREDFVMEVLRDATADALKEDVRYTQQELTLNLIYDNGQWWVIPDAALVSAISGGIA